MEWTYSSIHAFWHDKQTKIDKEQVLEWFGNRQQFWEFHERKPDDVYLIELEG
jgi:ribosomal protein L31